MWLVRYLPLIQLERNAQIILKVVVKPIHLKLISSSRPQYMHEFEKPKEGRKASNSKAFVQMTPPVCPKKHMYTRTQRKKNQEN